MSGSGTLVFFVPTGGGGCLSTSVTFTGIRVVTPCGNAVIDSGETCDDGNRHADDCCSPFCTLDGAGTSCTDGDPCTINACDGGGACTVSGPVDCDDGRPCTLVACDTVLGCVNVPDVRSCRSAQTSKLSVSTGDTGAALTWKWLKGESTSAAEFADPRASATYDFCLFAGTAPAVIDAEVEIPPDAQKWTASGDRGFKFKDATGDTGGVRRIILRASDSDRAKVVVKARHAAVSAPPLAVPVTAQLTNRDTNVCWSATWAGAEITLNESGKLKAETTAP